MVAPPDFQIAERGRTAKVGAVSRGSEAIKFLISQLKRTELNEPHQFPSGTLLGAPRIVGVESRGVGTTRSTAVALGGPARCELTRAADAATVSGKRTFAFWEGFSTRAGESLSGTQVSEFRGVVVGAHAATTWRALGMVRCVGNDGCGPRNHRYLQFEVAGLRRPRCVLGG